MEEAICLEAPGCLEWGRSITSEGRVCTPLSPSYPSLWLERLGDGAPPALWSSGRPNSFPRLGLVGSRDPTPFSLAFARRFVEVCARREYGVVSGGAVGIDRIAEGSSRCLRILPEQVAVESKTWSLTLSAPGEPFSVGRAMERNALIYAGSLACVVVQPRFRVGGTWQGAVDALRRRLCPVWVQDAGTQATEALVALGAVRLPDPEVWPAIEWNSAQLRLAV